MGVMTATQSPAKVAIVDYSLGNLFSVKHACQHAGLEATITSDKATVLFECGPFLLLEAALTAAGGNGIAAALSSAVAS